MLLTLIVENLGNYEGSDDSDLDGEELAEGVEAPGIGTDSEI